MKEVFPNLIEGCAAIGEVLGVTPEGARYLHRKGMIPAIKLGRRYYANRDALLECRRRGRYWSQGKRRAEALAQIAAEEAVRVKERALG